MKCILYYVVQIFIFLVQQLDLFNKYSDLLQNIFLYEDLEYFMVYK